MTEGFAEEALLSEDGGAVAKVRVTAEELANHVLESGFVAEELAVQIDGPLNVALA